MHKTVPNPRVQQPTIPNRAVKAPRPAPPPQQSLPPRPERKPSRPRTNWLLLAVIGVVGLIGSACLALTVGLVIVFNSGVLPGVTVAGVSVGGLSQQAAAARIESTWQTVTLRDGDRMWAVDRAEFGISIDAAATAEQAYQQGRGDGGLVAAVFGRVEVAPVVIVDTAVLRARLEVLAADVNIPPVDAGVRLIGGQVQATPAEAGKALDVEATIRQMTLDSGAIDLVMQPVDPRVTDASPMVAAASALLANPLEVRVYDPATGDSVYWQRPPEVWAEWLTAVSDAESPVGLRLSMDANAVRDFLNAESAVFDPVRHLRLDEAVAAIQDAIAQGRTSATLRVYHHPRQHTVQAGESITSIAWDYGVPYPWVQQANPGLTTLTIGQTITIPSVDDFLPYEPVPDKRIVVDISEQRTRVYEAGQLKWDWPASTGIADSPTWTGVYQIISHEPNAYAGNWNLWMPNFMGVYQPVPGADFTNGFHGFPTRGGGQLLWENSLGTRVTYGCILLSDTNVRLLYDWAQQGVVVEIRA